MTELQELKFLRRSMSIYSGRSTRQSDWGHYFQTVRLHRALHHYVDPAYLIFTIFNEVWSVKLVNSYPATIFQTPVN